MCFSADKHCLASFREHGSGCNEKIENMRWWTIFFVNPLIWSPLNIKTNKSPLEKNTLISPGPGQGSNITFTYKADFNMGFPANIDDDRSDANWFERVNCQLSGPQLHLNRKLSLGRAKGSPLATSCTSYFI